VPHPAFNLDTEQARASIRKLAELNPSAVWPGHTDPVTTEVAFQLERAASTPV
jgi:glyoxylase-like metal-dependent hydrolase (beta-lactamase superfamily II)